MKNAETPVAPRENPLVPFALMKRMYAGMVESRLLEAELSRRRGEGKRSPVAEQEAGRAAVLLNLEPGDLVSDIVGKVGAAWLRGAELGDAVFGKGMGLLPHFENSSQQLPTAMGASAALKESKSNRVVVVFPGADVKRRDLRAALRMAALQELPMLFVVFDPIGKEAAHVGISGEATRLGVPGIPVEGSDAVAICRVAQESLLRARAEGGPALLECVRLAKSKRTPDAVAMLGKAMLRVGACDRTWLDAVTPAFKARLKAIKDKGSAR